MTRKDLRHAARQEEVYQVCLERQLVDPLQLHRYFKRMGVFAAKDGLEADKDSQDISLWQACKLLENHYGIAKGTAHQRRYTKRKSKFLLLTCDTIEWMQKWVSDDFEVVSDGEDNEIETMQLLGLPMPLTEMFAEFNPRKHQTEAEV